MRRLEAAQRGRAASRADRPALARLLRHVRAGDTTRVALMDRLARSVIDLAQLVQDLTRRRVRVEFLAERPTFDPDPDDPFATFQLHPLGAVAQLERWLIRERQRDGLEIAKSQGIYRGRTRRLTPEQITTNKHLVDSGVQHAEHQHQRAEVERLAHLIRIRPADYRGAATWITDLMPATGERG